MPKYSVTALDFVLLEPESRAPEVWHDESASREKRHA